MNALVEWLQSMAGTDARTPDGPGSQSGSEPERESSLFHCQECGTVYVAYEKATCRSCGTPVEEVAANLHEK